MINLYRMALTENGLETGFFASLGIPKPATAYKAYSNQLPQSTGGKKRVGYKNAILQWTSLTPTQVNEICELIEAAKSGDGVIYVTFPKGNGEIPGMGWIDAYGLPDYPEIDQIQEPNINGLVLQAVTLTINNITIVNEPSTAVPD